MKCLFCYDRDNRGIRNTNDRKKVFYLSKKALVVYFTWTNGNTERIAKVLQQALRADILKITAPDDYHEDYDTVVRKSQEEIRRGYRPRVEPAKVDLSGYDTIAIGSPTWWYTIAPPMSTFLEANDFAGKTVVPFATNGGWPGHALKDIEKACKGADFVPGLAVQFDSTGGSQLVSSQDEICSWSQTVVKAVR